MLTRCSTCFTAYLSTWPQTVIAFRFIQHPVSTQNKFIRHCLGLAIFHRQFVDAYFITSLYKVVLGKRIMLSDLESVDAELQY